MKNSSLRPYLFLFALSILIHPTETAGQGWVRFIMPDSVYSDIVGMVAHPDGGLVVAYTANSPVLKAKLAHFNADGNLIWQQTVLAPADAKNIAVGADGLPSVLAYDKTANKMVLAHYDWQGNLLGASNIGDFNDGNVQLVAFPGGGFVSNLPYRDNPTMPPTKVALHRFTSSDSLLWRADIDALTGVPILENNGLAVNAQGQSLVGCHTGFSTSRKHHLTLIDAQGDSLWHRSNVYPLCVGVLADSNFFYVNQNYPALGTVLRKISPTGDLIWEKATDLFTVFILKGQYLATPEGGLVLCGIGDGLIGKTIRIQKFDNEGNQITDISREFPGYAEEDLYVTAFTQAPGGGYYVGGYISNGIGHSLSFVLRMDAGGHIFPQRIWGNMAFDANENCAVETGETGLPGHKIKIEDLLTGNTSYSVSSTGGWYVAETDSTQYQVSALPSNPYWVTCQPDSILDFSNGPDSIRLDFPLEKVVECPFLDVDISTLYLRRCFDNTYHVRYCNTGTAIAADAYVDVELDQHMSFLSSSIPGVQTGNHVWRFALGDIPFGDCGNFSLDVHLDCDSTVLGQTHCVYAHIYPDSFCLQNGLWSGAIVDVKGVCHPDSVDLVIKNIGLGANSGSLEYVIIEDNIIFRQGMFQLPAGDSLILRVPSNGSTWRLEADQEPFSPGDPMPSATVEGCGTNDAGNFSIGFQSQFGENDGNPYFSANCRENTGSFDPNDKQGFPKGVGAEHWIEPGIELEYVIRFQNTGTDTAFTVAVRDTLPEWLDPASIRTGASSHPYSFQLSGQGYLGFTFEHILLPDSTVNEPGSHGFVQFRVRVRPEAPIDTYIHNSAAIYFDFNDPVITNSITHRVGKDFLLSGTSAVRNISRQMTVSPNPAFGQTRVKFPGFTAAQGIIEMLDLQGNLVSRQRFTGDEVSLQAGTIPPGLYLIRAFEGETRLWNGKVVWLGK